MSGYECPQIENAGGYVLSAMPEGEWEAYGYHLAECGDCSAKVQELGCVSHALLSGVPQLTAPPDIRSRVMAIVEAESELLRASGAAADRPTPKSSRRFGFARLRPLTTGALAASLLAVGLGTGALLQSDSAASCSTRSATVVGASPLAAAELEVCDGNARLVLEGMKAPPEGRIYEAWLDDPNDRQGPKPAGLFSVRDGTASVDVGSVSPGQRVLVTDELLPNGSELPTRTPIVTVTT